MPGEMSRSYKGPKDGRVPSWMNEPSPPTLQRQTSTTIEFSTRIEITEPGDIDPELLERMAALVSRAIDREIERAIFGGPPPQARGTVTIDRIRPEPRGFGPIVCTDIA